MNKTLFDAEWIIMETLWGGQPQTLGQIIENIQKAHPEIKWNYKTYHTHLRRMAERELIANDTKNLKDKLYFPLITREDALLAESQEVLRHSSHFGSIGRLVKTLGENGQLSQTDQKELLDLARELEQNEGK